MERLHEESFTLLQHKRRSVPLDAEIALPMKHSLGGRVD